MKTVLDRILADMPLFKKFNKMVSEHPEFELIIWGSLGATHWKLGEYEFEKVSQPFGRFWFPSYWVIRKNGNEVIRTGHYKYVIGLCYKKLGLI